jgi:hypothetical protein
MIILDATTKKLQAVFAANATTTNPDYVVSYSDHTTTAYTPGISDGAMNGTTAVDICAAPASSTQRAISYICISNRDTVSHTLTFKYNNNGTTRVIFQCTLAVGSSCQYTIEDGWVVKTSTGSLITGTTVSLTGSAGQFFGHKAHCASLSTTTTFPNAVLAVYLGQATKSSTSLKVRFRVTTAPTTVTWSEAAVYVGDFAEISGHGGSGNPGIAINKKMLYRGYTDIATTILSTGIKLVTITISPACNIGDHIYVGFAQVLSAGSFAMRGAIGTDSAPGILLTTASGQPSTTQFGSGSNPMQGTTTNTAMPWVTGYLV